MTEDLIVRRESARYLARKDQILTVATEVLNSEGVSRFTLGMVAERMGGHPASLAYYFKKKHELIAACMQDTLARMEVLFEEIDPTAPAAERVSGYIHAYMRLRRSIYLRQEPPLASFNEIMQVGVPYASDVRRGYQHLRRRLGRLFHGSPAGSTSDRRVHAARLLLEQLLWSTAWLDPDTPDEFERVALRMSDILLNGLAPEGQAWPGSVLLDRAPPPSLARETPREAFLRAATQLLNEQGYRGASVEKISARLNVTKGSFYYHNADKDDVVEACFERTLGLIRDAQRRAGAGRSGWDRLCLLAANLIATQNAQAGPMVRAYNFSALHPDARLHMRRRFVDVAYRFASFVSEGIADGTIRSVDPLIAGQMIMALVNSAAYVHNPATALTRLQVMEDYVRPALVGLLNQERPSAPA